MRLDQNWAQSSQPRGKFKCPKCTRTYMSKKNLQLHLRLECGVPPSFSCPKCPYKGHRRFTVQMHLERLHGIPKGSVVVQQFQ